MLDYKNTAFRCRTCFQTGHLRNSCPQAKKAPKKKKRQAPKPRGWQFLDSLEDEKEESEQAETTEENTSVESN